VAANLCELSFVPLHTERFQLAVPTEFTSHPRVSGFLEFVLEELKAVARDKGTSSYDFSDLGRIEITGKTDKTD